jgi:predicted ArsR family transcriptional regulator
MFNKLMTMLRRGGTITIDQMARELETSPEVVSGMIDHLTRQGQLRAMSASCDSTCGACTFARDCGRRVQARTWVSTDSLQRMPAAKRIRSAG